jgi:hypothetical protein
VSSKLSQILLSCGLGIFIIIAPPNLPLPIYLNMPTEQPGQPIYSSEKPHIQFDKNINYDKAQTNSHDLSKFNSEPCTNRNEKVIDWIILPMQLPKDLINHFDMLETRCRETLQRLSSEPLLTE